MEQGGERENRVSPSLCGQFPPGPEYIPGRPLLPPCGIGGLGFQTGFPEQSPAAEIAVDRNRKGRASSGMAKGRWGRRCSLTAGKVPAAFFLPFWGGTARRIFIFPRGMERIPFPSPSLPEPAPGPGCRPSASRSPPDRRILTAPGPPTLRAARDSRRRKSERMEEKKGYSQRDGKPRGERPAGFCPERGDPFGHLFLQAAYLLGHIQNGVALACGNQAPADPDEKRNSQLFFQRTGEICSW